jgi:hypothetical protein
MKTDAFRGINNVADVRAHKPGEFIAATNVFIGTGNKLMMRPARSLIAAGVATSPFRWNGQLVVLLDSDLVLMSEDGVVQRTLYPSLGYTRVWYVELADGRLAFSNGLIQGLISPDDVAVSWGIQRPVDAGFGVSGNVRYHIAYVRSSDGLEGPPTYGTELIDPSAAIIGLPELAGHTINVYFAPDGGEAFYAGSTATDTFLWGSDQVGPQYIGSGLEAPPVGTQLVLWRSRVLLADGSVLWATKPLQPELCDVTRDFVQMPATITLVYGTDGGIFVGTTQGLYFLAGDTFGALVSRLLLPDPVTLGSLVDVAASEVQDDVRPKGLLRIGLCIVGGTICMLANGAVTPLTSQVYKRDVEEVYATTRRCNGHLLYLAAWYHRVLEASGSSSTSFGAPTAA